MNFSRITAARLRSILRQYKQKYVSFTSSDARSPGRGDALIVTRLNKNRRLKKLKTNNSLRSGEDQWRELHWSPHLEQNSFLELICHAKVNITGSK